MSSKRRLIYLYWSLLKDFNLSVMEGVFITLIWSLSKKDGSCYSGKKNLSKILNTSEATVFSLINRLTNRGLLEKVGFSSYGTSRYRPIEEITLYLNKINEIHY